VRASKAAPSGDSLAAANAQPFVANFQQAAADQDGKLSKSEFEAGCGKGLIKSTERESWPRLIVGLRSRLAAKGFGSLRPDKSASS
jgi:hypothetical protein